MPFTMIAAGNTSKFIKRYFQLMNKYKKKYDKDWRTRAKEIKNKTQKYTPSYQRKVMKGAGFSKYKTEDGEDAYVNNSPYGTAYVVKPGEEGTFNMIECEIDENNNPNMKRIVGFAQFSDVDDFARQIKNPRSLDIKDPIESLRFMREQDPDMKVSEILEFANGIGVSNEQLIEDDVLTQEEVDSAGSSSGATDGKSVDKTDNGEGGADDANVDDGANAAPDGEAGQCQKMIEDGGEMRQCKNPAENGSKYCWQHGGQKESMYQEMVRMAMECVPKLRCAYIGKNGRRCTRTARYGNYCWQHRKDKQGSMRRLSKCYKVEFEYYSGDSIDCGNIGYGGSAYEVRHTCVLVDADSEEAAKAIVDGYASDVYSDDYAGLTNQPVESFDSYEEYQEMYPYSNYEKVAFSSKDEALEVHDIPLDRVVFSGGRLNKNGAWVETTEPGKMRSWEYNGAHGYATIDEYEGDPMYGGRTYTYRAYDDEIGFLTDGETDSFGMAQHWVERALENPERYARREMFRRADNFATAPRVPDDIDVDSVNIDSCPLCGDPNFDGEFCNVCGYEEPPEGFDDIQLETQDDYNSFEEDMNDDGDEAFEFEPDDVRLDEDIKQKADAIADNVESEQDEYGIGNDEMQFA